MSYHGQPDALYRNNGDGTFTDVTKEAGLWNPEGRGMSVTVADFDNDGQLDIYVTNDAMANYYFRNLGNGKFVEEALAPRNGLRRRRAGRLLDGARRRRRRSRRPARPLHSRHGLRLPSLEPETVLRGPHHAGRAGA